MHDCKICNFSFKCNYDFNRHLKSKKHKEKINSTNLCQGCFKQFSTRSNKTRHEKKCKDNQFLCNVNIETQNNTNIGTQNNTNIINPTTTNITNIILPDNPEAIKTFVMTYHELCKKRTTDCIQKFILDAMFSNDDDLMDYIEKFDKEIELKQAEIVQDHNRSCYSYMNIKKVDGNGEEYEEEIKMTPLTHPERKWNCRHIESEFKLEENDVSNILAKTLLDKKVVVTHDNDIHGKRDLLFKHQSNLHADDILLQFISKSNKKDYFNLSEDFKPATQIQKDYPEYYDKLEEKAKNIMQAFGRKTKNSKK